MASGRRVIMVGDGLNDAAAMSAASVGFAVHGGAEASLLAAGVFATEPGVAPVLEAIRGARQTLSAIRRGLAFSLAYNAVGVGLAMSGMLSPLLAAVMMPLSSLTVLTSALHSRAFRAPARDAQESDQS
jgi:Cu2+-exporting ATPase